MIAAIVRKDMELHWLAAIAIPILYLAINLAAIRDPDQQTVDAMSMPLYIAGFYLLTALVQGDPIPGDQADWLIRPVPRITLLAAKLAFVAIVFVVPMVAIDLILPVVMGFSLGHAASVAAGHLVSMVGGLILPTMAIAAATSSLAQCALGGVIAAFGYSLLLPYLPWSVERDMSILSWVEDAAALAIAVTISVLVLSLQYLGRRTHWSYLCCVLGLVAFAGLARIPLSSLWDLQAEYRPAKGVEEATELKVSAKEVYLSSGSPLLVHVPVETKGRNADVSLFPQRALMRIRFANGEVREAESRDLRNASFENGVQHFAFDFGIDPELYELRRLPATAEISFHFLAFEPFRKHEFQKEGEAQFIPETGRCQTHRNKEAIIGECLKIGDDSPVGFAPTPKDLKWYELSLSRLSPVFMRFRPTVFSWTVRLVEKTKIEVDIDGNENYRTQFKAYEVPVRVHASSLQGVLVRTIQLPEMRFWELRFRASK